MMKKKLYTSLVSLLLLSCGGGDDSDSANTAPTTPSLTSPSNSLLCLNNQVTFDWEDSIDSENDAISYQLQIAEDNQFTKGLITKQSTISQQTLVLNKGVAYYWRVKAIDNLNASSDYSSIYSLYTEGPAKTNHLPFLPQIVSPEYNLTIAPTAAQLKWTASDPDSGDILKYDVYLGTANPPTAKVSSDISITNVDVSSSIQAATVYYWQVVVKDNKGGETKGQIWNFKTE